MRAVGQGAGAAALLGLMLALAGCADSGVASAPATVAPASCPETLAYLKDRLVTPYAELETFMSKEALDKTFSEPIDDMIARGGGIEASIQGGQNHVEEYRNTLKNKEALRAELRGDKMTDQWIDTYFLSVQDGITINQGFVDAVKCRQLRAQAQGSSAS